MCGRFTASFEFHEIKLLFVLQRDLPLLTPRYNIAPSQEVPVIIQSDGINELKPMKWGLVPSWSPDRSIGNNMINARSETIKEKPSFRRLIESKRCLIPADGFYEWRREGNRKVPVWFHLKNKQPFAFAGLWDTWRDVDGEVLYTFTINNHDRNALMRRIHNRMSVIFDRLQAKQWLDPRLSTRSADIAADFAPFPSEQMQAHDALGLRRIRRVAFFSATKTGQSQVHSSPSQALTHSHSPRIYLRHYAIEIKQHATRQATTTPQIAPFQIR